MKRLLSLAALLILFSCGGSKVQTSLNLQLADYFFDRTIGGTPEAGISKTFWLKPQDPNLIIETIKLADQSKEAEAQKEGYYTATFFFKEGNEMALANSHALEYFGSHKKVDMQIHGEIDSVALREEVFMPTAPRHK